MRMVFLAGGSILGALGGSALSAAQSDAMVLVGAISLYTGGLLIGLSVPRKVRKAVGVVEGDAT